MPKDTPRTPVGRAPASKTAERRAKAHAYSLLKLVAENMYVCNDHGISCSDIAALPEFVGVDVSTINQWAQHGEWAQRRKKYLNRLREKIETFIGGQMMQQRKKQLQMYESLHQQMAAYVLPNAQGHVTLTPRSAEGAITAMLKIEAAAAVIRQQMAESVGGSITGQAGPDNAAAQMSPADAQALAHLLLAKQNSIAAPDEEPAPPAKLIIDAAPDAGPGKSDGG